MQRREVRWMWVGGAGLGRTATHSCGARICFCEQVKWVDDNHGLLWCRSARRGAPVHWPPQSPEQEHCTVLLTPLKGKKRKWYGIRSEAAPLCQLSSALLLLSLFRVCRGLLLLLFFFPFHCISHCPGTQDHCITSETRVSCQPYVVQYSRELTHQILIINPIQQTNTINCLKCSANYSRTPPPQVTFTFTFIN